MTNKTKTDLYELEYFMTKSKQIKNVTLKWTLHNFNKNCMAVCVPKDGKSSYERVIETTVEDYAEDFDKDLRFELKIESPKTDGEAIQISYATQVSLYMRVICNGPNIHSSMEFGVFGADVWHPIPVEFVHNDIVNQFTFKFIIDTGYYQLKRIIIPKSQLKDDLMNLMKSSIYSDVTIKSVDGTDFHVHKAILGIRSDFFKAHFENKTDSNVTDGDLVDDYSTEIIDSPFAADVIEQVLAYIYTDTALEVEKMAEDLLKAAEFYKLQRLKKLCEDALHKDLTVENAVHTLELADAQKATDLKKITLEFIDGEKAKQIIETPSWKKLESVELIKSIFESVVSNMEA